MYHVTTMVKVLFLNENVSAIRSRSIRYNLNLVRLPNNRVEYLRLMD